MLVPCNESHPGIVIEFKAAKVGGRTPGWWNRDCALRQVAETALAQIRERNHAATLLRELEHGKISGILAYGISFCGKAVHVLSETIAQSREERLNKVSEKSPACPPSWLSGDKQSRTHTVPPFRFPRSASPVFTAIIHTSNGNPPSSQALHFRQIPRHARSFHVFSISRHSKRFQRSCPAHKIIFGAQDRFLDLYFRSFFPAIRHSIRGNVAKQ